MTPDGGRVLFLRSRHGTDPVGRLWSLDVATGEERLLADPSVLLDRRRGRAVPRRARPPRAVAGGIVRHRGLRHRHGPRPSPPSRCRAGSGSPTCGTGDTRELPATGPVIDPRPDPTGSWVAYAGDRRAARRARRRLRPPGAGRSRRTTTSPGGWLSSWRRRRWTAIAASGGRRTAPQCSRRGSTRRRCSAGTSPTRRTRQPCRRRSPTRPRARTTRSSTCTCSASTAAGSPSPGTTTPFLTSSPRTGATTATRCSR